MYPSFVEICLDPFPSFVENIRNVFTKTFFENLQLFTLCVILFEIKILTPTTR